MDASLQQKGLFLATLIVAFGYASRVQVVAQDEAITIDPDWEDNDNNHNGGVHNEPTVVLQSPIVTDWGRWGRFAHCSMRHSYVTGFQLKVETKETRNDNTAVNGINLSCGIPEQKEIERIDSAKGPWGTGRTRKLCAKGPAVGFQLKVQKPQGREIDDVATVNVKMICGNGQILEGYDEQGDYYVDTVWSDPIVCPDNMAVCGIQTQVEPRRWLGDDTALNNIRIRCCSLPMDPSGGQQEQQVPTTEGATESLPPQGINVTEPTRQAWRIFKEWFGRK